MLFVYYPRCSTCQKAKKWLDEHDIEYEERRKGYCKRQSSIR